MTVAAEMRRLIRCPGCGTVLAATVAGLSVVTRSGYEWVGIVVSIKCAECYVVWRPEAGDAGAVQLHASGAASR